MFLISHMYLGKQKVLSAALESEVSGLLFYHLYNCAYASVICDHPEKGRGGVTYLQLTFEIARKINKDSGTSFIIIIKHINIIGS